MTEATEQKTTNNINFADKKQLEKITHTDAQMESGNDKGIPWEKAKKQLLSRGKK